jgi:elongation factor G
MSAVALAAPAARQDQPRRGPAVRSRGIDRQGSVDAGSSIGDSSPKRAPRGGSTELNLYNFDYLGDRFAIIDAPARSASPPTARGRSRSPTSPSSSSIPTRPRPLAEPALRQLDELGIPHLIFVNRIDQAHGRIRDLLSALQPMSVSPLIARQIPIRDGEKVTGFVDLALERAFITGPASRPSGSTFPPTSAEREARSAHPHARAARRP